MHAIKIFDQQCYLYPFKILKIPLTFLNDIFGKVIRCSTVHFELSRLVDLFQIYKDFE